MKLTGFFYDHGARQVQGEHGAKAMHSNQNHSARPHLPEDLVALNQTASLVSLMRQANPQFSRVNIAVTDRIDRVPSFLAGREGADFPEDLDLLNPRHWFEALKDSVTDITDSRSSADIFRHGGVLIEFKKY